MVDIALKWTDSGADIVLDAADLTRGNDIKTAVLTSLFSDARATDSQVDDDNKRGWWADFTKDFGSLMWLLEREKLTEATAQRARDYCRAALAWLITEGIASKTQIDTTIVKSEGLKIRIIITRGANKKYDYAWQGIKDEAYTFNGTTLQVTFN